MRPLKRVVAATTLLLALTHGLPATACPNCKEALASQTGEGAKLKDGYYYSILFMMAMPFALLGTGAFCVVRAVKKGTLPEM
ncbi:MAG: hypothetical protein JWN86_3644 [Planctomycetota bacterium]|nr:hypothetical protein [Planctomycetota bacterium]